MVIAGRVKWFYDDYSGFGAKYFITTNAAKIGEMMMKNGQPIPPGYPFVTVVESGNSTGRYEALASIHIDGKAVDAYFPLENAETSSR